METLQERATSVIATIRLLRTFLSLYITIHLLQIHSSAQMPNHIFRLDRTDIEGNILPLSEKGEQL